MPGKAEGWILFHAQTKESREKLREAVVCALATISIPGLGFLVINLDINKIGSLMHRLTYVHRVFW